MTYTYIETLQKAILDLHGVESTHVESVPVKEVFQGQTVWEGVVEVFELQGHPVAPKAYAWAHSTDDPNNPMRHVTVLHVAPVNLSDSRGASINHSGVQEQCLKEWKLRTPETAKRGRG